MRFILASASPRRKDLLSSAGFDFEVRRSAIEEAPIEGESPEAYARRVARDKALSVAASAAPGRLVLGADTIVVAGNEILGKPLDTADAARMLRKLSGVSHRVITGVCLVRAPDKVEALAHETTVITFRALDDKEIADYVASGEPMDKAGAYGIQGLACKFVTRVEGCYFNVVGLPVAVVYGLLKPFLSE
ncbi:MAG: septum formation inhibitor Maf [Acidobacteria bacterium]|nr:septum formation inhibitor Maf [Acidobacteriota bacterium]